MPALLERVQPVGRNKPPQSFRISDVAIACLEELSRKRGVSKTAILEQAIRDYYAQTLGKAPPETKPKKST